MISNGPGRRRVRRGHKLDTVSHSMSHGIRAGDSKRGGRHVGGYNHAVRTFVCQRYRDAAAGPDVCNLNWPEKWLAFTAAEKA